MAPKTAAKKPVKKIAKKPAKKAPKKAAKRRSSSGVTVRMYRQGLGDCFLLTFPSESGKPFHMLIDCGVILGTKKPEDIMTRVVEDIHATTGGEIHLLAITHEHWDHVSGFVQAETVFRRFRVHNVWFAWTEDPQDELARKLDHQFNKDLDGLRVALRRAVHGDAFSHVTNLLGFFGDAPTGLAAAGGGNLGAAGRKGTGDALEVVREIAKASRTEPEYRRPGEDPLRLRAAGVGEVPGVRVYILGPPHDERTLRRINPTVKGKEVYTEGAAVTARTAFLMAVQDEASMSNVDRELRDLSFPFDERLRLPVAEAKERHFFQQHYGFDDLHPAGAAAAGAALDTTLEGATPGEKRLAECAEAPRADRHSLAWRRIDDDWLGTAGEIALQLDSYTNNTSLAMAIELTSSGKVLLFVADAQVGNWLSWDNLTWTVKEGRQTREVKTADLLERTVLYKVGHHGSHNATVRGLGDEPRGLELMSHPELVALIPVHHDTAVTKGWTKMPFAPLVDRLKQKCAGRVFRIDDPFPRQERPDGMSDAAWENFRKDFRETELYMEYTLRE